MILEPGQRIDLDLWDFNALEKAEANPIPSGLASMRVGAQLYSSMPLDDLLARLSQFLPLSRVVLADDHICDADMPRVESAFKARFPRAHFEWDFDGLIAGKHGR